MKKNKNRRNGFMALIAVLIVSAVGLSVSIFLLFIGSSFSETILNYEKSLKALNYAEACMDKALFELYLSSDNTIIPGNILFEDGFCYYEMNHVNNVVNLSSVGEVDSLKRMLTVPIIEFSPKIIIDSWSEIKI